MRLAKGELQIFAVLTGKQQNEEQYLPGKAVQEDYAKSSKKKISHRESRQKSSSPRVGSQAFQVGVAPGAEGILSLDVGVESLGCSKNRVSSKGNAMGENTLHRR